MEEAQQEVLMDSNNNNKSDQQSQIVVKGKRTKRQRPQSPIPFVVGTNDNNIGTNVSPAESSAGEFFGSTEEDEDMANCLILLAQCRSRESPKRAAHYDHQEEIGQIQIHNHNSKFNSRRFLEAPPSSGTGTGTGTGKGGYSVYECKTCNRTFPSFQALGGHRASHKKPKAMMNEERSLKQQQQFLVSNSDEEDGNFRNVSSLSLQLSNNNNNNNKGGGNSNLYSSNNMKSNKIHECSICGAEFTSGQALGGHMRRHRAAPVATTTTTTTNTTLSLTPMAEEVEEPRKSGNNGMCLDLDLNLPAPEDDLRESKVPFSSKQQQKQQQHQQKSSLVFSAGPTLVDCHY